VDEPVPGAGQDPPVAVDEPLDVVRGRHAGEDDLGGGRDLARASGLRGAPRHEVVDPLAAAVGHHGQPVPLLDEVLGHAVAHEADADKSDARHA
jgi:hypothetical protein